MYDFALSADDQEVAKEWARLKGSGTASEDVDRAVRAPLLHAERSLVSEARALSHYSGDAF